VTSVVRNEAGFYLVSFFGFPAAATDGESRTSALDEVAVALLAPGKRLVIGIAAHA